MEKSERGMQLKEENGERKKKNEIKEENERMGGR